MVDTEYIRAVAHCISHRARIGVAEKVRKLKLAHSRARLRSYTQAYERSEVLDEYLPSLYIRHDFDKPRNLQLRRKSLEDEDYSYDLGLPNVIELKINKSLYNEPIYERDEDPLGLGLSPSSSTYVNPVDNNGLNGLDLSWTNSAPLPHPTNLIGTQNGGAGDFANWPTEKTNGLPSPLDEVQKQFEEMKTSTSRNKADEWLDDVLRVSMTMSPTSNKSSAPVTPSTSFSNYSQLENATSSKSGPPPAHAPPPLPTKQAISNGNPSMYQPILAPTRITPSPVSNVNWNSSPVAAQIIAKQPKPIDPFDVQWSRLAVNPAAENA